ncbi:MAG: hypothetical protein N3A01_08215 [Bacteroidales bacterium]|nr:hypothetical protein [Bacteroidales bacterium]
MNSQFYNGLQNEFGKSRIQYRNFIWQYYRFKRFDVYFSERGENLAKYVAEKVNKYLPEIESILGTTLNKRIIFIVYHNINEFKQSNIGLITGNEQYNIGGTTQIIDNKVFLFYEGVHYKFDIQIRKAIAQIVLNEALYGAELKSKIANSLLLSIPKWYYEGLISYISEEWNDVIETFIRDGIKYNYLKKINNLEGEMATYLGHSLWFFIAYKYSKQVIPNILYLTRISKNIETGFLYTIGLSIKELSLEWRQFYKNLLENSDNITDSVLYVSKKGAKINNLAISPDKKFIAFSINNKGKIKIYLYNKNSNKKICIYKQGYKIDQIHDYSYPVIAWHPSSKVLLFITEKKGSKFMYTYDVETNEIFERELFNIDKIVDASYSEMGYNIIFSGVRNGVTDLYSYNFASNTMEKITSDLADDINPVLIDNSQKILFISNRPNILLSDSLSNNYNLYIYNTSTDSLTRITNIEGLNFSPTQYDVNKYIFLSNQTNIFNLYKAEYDSTIDFIDTIVHYRYYSNVKPLTNNLSANIQKYSLLDDNTFYYVTYRKKKEIIAKGNYNFNSSVSYNESPLKKLMQKKYRNIDTTLKQKQSLKIDTFKTTIKIDTNNIDYRHYVFNFEIYKKPFMHESKKIIDKSDSSLLAFKPNIYLMNFYINKIVSQVDFGFLNNSYQQFTGGPFYYNPGMNFFIKMGVNDLFEDYKIVGGIRLSGNLNSNEYLLSLENLKNRLDKQIAFHRLAINKIDENFLVKTHTHEGFYILKYPFSEIQCVKFTINLRHDNNVYLATDIQSLYKKNTQNLWFGFKTEYIFDNTFFKQLNIYNGLRMKVFYEFYYRTTTNYRNLNVTGFDVRYYQPLHRNFIFATRLAGSSSFGSAKLLYYLGSVDNWINLSPNVPVFDRSVNINYSQPYAFQAIATNMRGFSQNIRNGTNFIVFNNELRLPIFRYLFNRPLQNEFLENFQLVGFFDCGTAWTGKSPFSKENAYNTETIISGPITIVIDKQRDPIVWGYGFGVRSKLFGYFVRADYAWGIENNIVLKPIFYLSLSLDF